MSEELIVKEHKLGCSVATPKCPNCKKFYDSMGHKMYPWATGGYHFVELSFRCTKCGDILRVPQSQIETLNKYADVSRKSFYNIVWQSPPSFKIEKKGETFYPV